MDGDEFLLLIKKTSKIRQKFSKKFRDDEENENNKSNVKIKNTKII